VSHEERYFIRGISIDGEFTKTIAILK